jgi:nucleotide-binding universal stress UspA family protein
MGGSTATELRIVVGVDGSPGSEEALRWAARIARAEHASIDAVGVSEPSSAATWSGVPVDGRSRDEVEKSVVDVVDRVFGAHRPADLQLRVREGHPVPVLIQESDSALMLVVGSRGHGGFAGLLLGSVSARVAELARCPVLVVHDDQDAPGEPPRWITT